MNIPRDCTFGGAHRTEASSPLDGFPFLARTGSYDLLLRIFKFSLKIIIVQQELGLLSHMF